MSLRCAVDALPPPAEASAGEPRPTQRIPGVTQVRRVELWMPLEGGLAHRDVHGVPVDPTWRLLEFALASHAPVLVWPVQVLPTSSEYPYAQLRTVSHGTGEPCCVLHSRPVPLSAPPSMAAPTPALGHREAPLAAITYLKQRRKVAPVCSDIMPFAGRVTRVWVMGGGWSHC